MNSQYTSPSTLQKEKSIIIGELSLPSDTEVKFIDSGWDNRVYYVPKKGLYYKFPRSEHIRQRHTYEISAIRAAHDLHSDVILPEIVKVGDNNRYCCYKAIPGDHLSDIIHTLSDAQKRNIGKALGSFLKAFHQLSISAMRNQTVNDELRQFEEWSLPALNYLKKHLDTVSYGKISNAMQNTWPRQLIELGVKNGLCHGDFHGNNVFVNGNELGVIDFGDVAYMDISKDFTGITDKTILGAMINEYGADDVFMQKVILRSNMFEIIRLTANLGKNDDAGTERALNRIKKLINS